jgi:hypothetical protein
MRRANTTTRAMIAAAVPRAVTTSRAEPPTRRARAPGGPSRPPRGPGTAGRTPPGGRARR